MKSENNTENTSGGDCQQRLVRPHALWRDVDRLAHAGEEFARIGLPIPAIRKIGMFWLRWVGEGDIPPRLPYPEGPGWPKFSGQLQPYHSDEWEFMGQHDHPDASGLEAVWIWMNESTCRAAAGIRGIGLSPQTNRSTLDSTVVLSAAMISSLAND
jgi:hypothetical protein